MSKRVTEEDARLFGEPLQPGVVLADVQIRQLVASDQLIAEDTFEERGLDCCSYDIRIGNKAIVGGQGTEIDLSQDQLEISPGGYAAVISYEKVRIPTKIVVRINSKRSFSYEGIALLTGTQIDPGYEGYLLFGFYNASSKRVILRRGRQICSLVFEALGGHVERPKSSDPDLLLGSFPDRFVNDMANMEVLSWQQLSEHVKEIDRITKDILELRAKYEDVVQPIKELTANVGALSQDVDKLSGSIRVVGEQVSKLEGLAAENARNVGEVTMSVKLLVSEVSSVKKDTERLASVDDSQENQLSKLAKEFGKFSLLVYVFWAVLLLLLGGVLTSYVLPKLAGGQ